MGDERTRANDGRLEEAIQPPVPWSVGQEVAVYLLAALGYILLGFLVKGVFAWWPYGTAFLLLIIWGAPAAWRRLA